MPLGVTLLSDLPEHNDKVIPALAPLRVFGGSSLLGDVVATILVGRDQACPTEPWVSARTIRVDSTQVGVLDFGISRTVRSAPRDTGRPRRSWRPWDERA